MYDMYDMYYRYDTCHNVPDLNCQGSKKPLKPVNSWKVIHPYQGGAKYHALWSRDKVTLSDQFPFSVFVFIVNILLRPRLIKNVRCKVRATSTFLFFFFCFFVFCEGLSTRKYSVQYLHSYKVYSRGIVCSTMDFIY